MMDTAAAQILEVIVGDCRESLAAMEAGSVQCCVTSPPYWGLRDYGTPELYFPPVSFVPVAGLPPVDVPAWRGHLGHEPDPWMFVGHMVAIFREVHRVMKDDGTLWMNLGDCYATGAGAVGDCPGGGPQGSRGGSGKQPHNHAPIGPMTQPNRMKLPGLKPKDMMGMPWRVAFALQADGWWLRRDVIWSKPSPMPESTKDRPTTAHEYIFILAKAERYYYNAEAIKEPTNGTAHPRGRGTNPKCAGWADAPGAHRAIDHAKPGGTYKGSVPGRADGPGQERRSKLPRQNPSFSAAVTDLVDSRNKRSVWTVPSKPYSEAHFATYPPDLIKPCILAGSRPGDLVLDPFAGSGTTGAVAIELGRRAVLCELNPEYAKMIERRTTVTFGLALQ